MFETRVEDTRRHFSRIPTRPLADSHSKQVWTCRGSSRWWGWVLVQWIPIALHRDRTGVVIWTNPPFLGPPGPFLLLWVGPHFYKCWFFNKWINLRLLIEIEGQGTGARTGSLWAEWLTDRQDWKDYHPAASLTGDKNWNRIRRMTIDSVGMASIKPHRCVTALRGIWHH